MPDAIAAVGVLAAVASLLVWARGDGIDLRVYRDAVIHWRAGGNPYQAVFTRRHLAFTYPPFALLALAPLALVSFPVAEWLLWTFSMAAGTVCVVLVLRDRGIAVTRRTWCGAVTWSCFSVVALEPVRSALNYGQIELLLMVAVLAGVLASPISWNHHWVWLLLIPPLLAGRRGDLTRPVQALLWGLVAVAVLAPYWWFSQPIPAAALDAVLPLWAGTVLVAWAVSCARKRPWPAAPRSRPGVLREAAPGSPVPEPAARG